MSDKRPAHDGDAGLIAACALMIAQIVEETDIKWSRVNVAILEARRLTAQAMRSVP